MDISFSILDSKQFISYPLIDLQELTRFESLNEAVIIICCVLCRQPEFCKWAFNLPRGEACLRKWDTIPDDTDILVTHTPPIGHGDLCCTGVRAGCVELLSTVQQRVRPKYHIFGHVHEGKVSCILVVGISLYYFK